ncbi:TAXI family TRAP transporter solute-binding subunit [Roseococcus sp. YIM B11640]|uniref:TAXI family TRAP transporter solute-binding subunit n=1 Tax=Roseococcus sp. YIM B11640 TaxID=3133973 RepID=UPI003C799AFE
MPILLPRRSLLAASLAVPAIRTAAAQTTLEWVAGSLGGGWYTMAAGLASLIREENPDLQVRVVPGGGLANPTRIQNGQSQMGWGIDAFTASAFKGEEPYTAAHSRLRSLGTGYSPTDHYLLGPKDGPTGMREILTTRGLKLGTPQRSSTDEMSAQRILRFLGTSPDQIRSGGGRYLNGSYNDIAAAFNDGQVDYIYICLARPAAILTEIAQGRRSAKLIAFPDDVRAHMKGTYAYAEASVPVAAYPSLLTAPIMVTAMDSVVLAAENVPEAAVYAMTKTFIKNKGQRLATIHASMEAYDPASSARYSGCPLHPGAARAYREAGVLPA